MREKKVTPAAHILLLFFQLALQWAETKKGQVEAVLLLLLLAVAAGLGSGAVCAGFFG